MFDTTLRFFSKQARVNGSCISDLHLQNYSTCGWNNHIALELLTNTVSSSSEAEQQFIKNFKIRKLLLLSSLACEGSLSVAEEDRKKYR